MAEQKEGSRPIDYITKRAQRSAYAAHESARQIELELVSYKTGDKSLAFNIDVTGDNVWATQHQIADLYDRDKKTISEHILNILAEGELDESAVVRKFQTTGKDGKAYDVLHYDLDMILAVGMRAKSPKASQFRKWALQTLRSYIVDGYAINEARLRDDPEALNALAAKLRALRAEEKNVYASVREFFKLASTDYDSTHSSCRSFYASLQDKFHFAITGKTAAAIILDRADRREPNMGIRAFGGGMPTMEDAKIAKSYLDQDELYALHLLCEQFLLFVESKAMRGKTMTMAELGKKLDDLLRFNDYPVFPGYKDRLHDKAVKHAQVEFALYSMKIKGDDIRRVS